MQISKQKLDKQTEIEIVNIFYQLLTDINNTDEAQSLLSGILTDSELTTLAKRVAVATYLEQGQSYESIKDQLKVSSATIATVQSKLSHDNGLSLALQKIKTDQWADKWARRISDFLGGN